MKLVVVVIIVVTSLLNCTYTLSRYQESESSSPVIISQRVGEVIDAEERLQFRLFTGVEDFESARIYEIPEEGYDVEILTKDGKFIAFNRNRDAVIILREFIDRYELIKDSMSLFEEKWGIVDYDVLGQPITKNEVMANAKGYWPATLATAGFLGGCIGSCLIGGMPNLGLDSPTGEDADFDEKILIYTGVGVLGFTSGLFLGREFDKRDALRSIKDARKPRKVE